VVLWYVSWQCTEIVQASVEQSQILARYEGGV
jgi:hypothetical protein